MDDNLLQEYAFDTYSKEELNEIDPLTGALIFGSAGIIIQLTVIFSGISVLYKKSVRLPKYEKKLTELIGGNWEVRSLKVKTPTAFTAGDLKIIWVTEPLVKLLNERELMAILLHHSHFQMDHRFLKHIAFQYPLFYIFTYVLLTVTLPGGWLLQVILSALCFRLMLVSADLPYKYLTSEYHTRRADDFAIQHGYGDDLLSAVEKMEKTIKKLKEKKECGVWCKAVNIINGLMIKHPNLRQKVENMATKSDVYVSSIISCEPGK